VAVSVKVGLFFRTRRSVQVCIKKFFSVNVKVKGLTVEEYELKPLALCFLAVAVFLLLLYCGLQAAEQGIQKLMALEGAGRALNIESGDGQITITFAGRNYLLPYRLWLQRFWFWRY